jgi:nucleoid-associated protein YgaU
MGPNPPDVIDGFGGGYTVTPRKRRRSLTDFDTLNPIRIQIEMMFDRFAQRESVEKEIRTLEKMGAIPDESSEPPHLIYDAGGSGPHDKKRAKHNRWVISEPIVWSQQKWHPKRRFRTRIMATVVLQQVVQDKHLKLRKKAKKKKPGFDKNDKCKERKDPRKKFYTVKKGDTLAKIAARFYGDSDCWKKIARANDIRDPKKVKVGKKIKLP